MGFIDKALEKAKAAHQDKEPAAVSPGQRRDRPTPPPPRPPRAMQPSLSPEEIYYTVTRTVEVNPEVLRRQKLMVEGKETPGAEEYKLLRTHILQRTRGDGRNTLMVTGPLPGEGKTMTAINLALSISQEVNQTVLLVDGDLRSPSVHRYFGLPSGPGLVDFLTGRATLPELLVHPQGMAKLVLLPGGRPAIQAPELINSPMMADLVQELKHFYPDRYVIFDLPPLLACADALAFAPVVDGIILVVEAGKTPREDILRSLGMLKDLPVLGFVLNKVGHQPSSYYYYSSYSRSEAAAKDGKRRFPWFRQGK